MGEIVAQHGMTVEEIKLLGRIIDRGWDAIAADMFYNERGERDESMTFDRPTVAEVALDADRYKAYYSEDELAEAERVVKKYWDLQYKEMMDIQKQAMPYSTYGY